MVKNPPAMWETWVQSLGWEEPLEEGMATNSSILAWRIPMDREAWQATLHGVAKKSDATEWLRTILSKTIRSQRGGAAHRGENYRWRPLVICLSIQLHLVSCYSGSLTFIYLFSPLDSGLPVVSILSEKEVLKNNNNNKNKIKPPVGTEFCCHFRFTRWCDYCLALHWLSCCSSHLLSTVP